ncbi:septal ring lytic transglycosylase RlpA [Bacterioplanes sanyensis]|uniref:Endolytic peptidoglycan transglycosylase RlpA n=1 Tax=Bacterioplanes sanyensis TaxID=1249553 RepID=A0A222FQE9_9GAMM|nr:septal ring lytic transglycosylase RlpA family protein [Bacterioplanes sanyensis]ASP40736.1 septal ring lytic transglycosylase RlpA [Bacterioplanes sanyensis]
MTTQWAALAALVLILTGCATSRYQHQHDFTPPPKEGWQQLTEPTPKTEPRSVLGNPDSYEVLGQRYQVMREAHPYSEEGIASWYGMKFHGHQTSNGETYDVYAFTAAHKTLPLPSYVRVTRLDTGANVVVRVNDRGPFHQGRIIDLSYVAAKRLDMHKQGTAPVRIEVLKPPEPHSVRWLQVAALSDAQAAARLQQRLQTTLQQRWPVTIAEHKPSEQRPIHRVRIGPVKEGQDLEQLQELLRRENISAIVLAGHQ